MVQNQTRRIKKAQGGKFKGEGSYGCAYAPALYCKTNAERSKNTISKIMYKDAAEKEWVVKKMLTPVDPEQKYFLYPSRLCLPDFARFNVEENNPSPCKHFEGKTIEELFEESNKEVGKYIILESKLGGVDLTKIELNTAEYLPFFKDFARLFEGLAILHSKHLTHLDIKDENIVVKRNNVGGFEFRYIDFGFLTDIYTYDSSNDTAPLYTDYYIWPYDLRFISKRLTNDETTEERVIKSWNIDDLTDESIAKWEHGGKAYLSHYVNINKVQQYGKQEYATLYQGLQSKSRNEVLSKILKGTDLYSLGIVLAKMWYYHIGHTDKSGHVNIVKPFGPKTAYPVAREPIPLPASMAAPITAPIKTASKAASLPRYLAPTTSSVAKAHTALKTTQARAAPMTPVTPIIPTKIEPSDWHIGVLSELSPKIYSLIYRMMTPNVLERITAKEAYNEYKALFPLFEKYFRREVLGPSLRYIFPSLPSPISPPPTPHEVNIRKRIANLTAVLDSMKLKNSKGGGFRNKLKSLLTRKAKKKEEPQEEENNIQSLSSQNERNFNRLWTEYKERRKELMQQAQVQKNLQTAINESNKIGKLLAQPLPGVMSNENARRELELLK